MVKQISVLFNIERSAYIINDETGNIQYYGLLLVLSIGLAGPIKIFQQLLIQIETRIIQLFSVVGDRLVY